MMEFPSSKIIPHLWRFHEERGIYMAIFRINLPFLWIFSSINKGDYRKK
jgi:hypothetical protein